MNSSYDKLPKKVKEQHQCVWSAMHRTCPSDRPCEVHHCSGKEMEDCHCVPQHIKDAEQADMFDKIGWANAQISMEDEYDYE